MRVELVGEERMGEWKHEKRRRGDSRGEEMGGEITVEKAGKDSRVGMSGEEMR